MNGFCGMETLWLTADWKDRLWVWNSGWRKSISISEGKCIWPARPLSAEWGSMDVPGWTSAMRMGKSASSRDSQIRLLPHLPTLNSARSFSALLPLSQVNLYFNFNWFNFNFYLIFRVAHWQLDSISHDNFINFVFLNVSHLSIPKPKIKYDII